MEAAVHILALEDRGEEWGPSIEFLRDAQNPNGGWGPYRHAPSEPFDTALALLALKAVENRVPEVAPWITHGRAWLLLVQRPSGGWTETTRPAGSQSYAQHISTSGWATMALLATSR
jgi:squalene cyclase